MTQPCNRESSSRSTGQTVSSKKTSSQWWAITKERCKTWVLKQMLDSFRTTRISRSTWMAKWFYSKNKLSRIDKSWIPFKRVRIKPILLRLRVGYFRRLEHVWMIISILRKRYWIDWNGRIRNRQRICLRINPEKRKSCKTPSWILEMLSSSLGLWTSYSRDKQNTPGQ